MQGVFFNTRKPEQRKLDFAERWLRDGLDECRPAAFHQLMDLDMSGAKAIVALAKRQGYRITYTHVLIKAIAITLAINPDLHILVCGNRAYQPNSIDIGLSVAGESFVAPVLVLSNADKKDIVTLAEEIRTRAPQVRAADRRLLDFLRAWGWLLPFAFLRRTFLKILFRSYGFRTKGCGTFQLSVLTNVDQAVTPMFSTTAILVCGRVRDSVVAQNGVAVVRPTAKVSLSADHRVWDGRAGERFLMTLQSVLSSSQLSSEFLDVDTDGGSPSLAHGTAA